MVDCSFWSRTRDRGAGHCALGWYGGRPWLANCKDCLANNRNNAAAKAAFDARMLQAHPTNAPRVSGCCDRADQE